MQKNAQRDSRFLRACRKAIWAFWSCLAIIINKCLQQKSKKAEKNRRDNFTFQAEEDKKETQQRGQKKRAANSHQ